MDELLARHVAHLFIRDPVSLFEEKIHQSIEDDIDHFEVSIYLFIIISSCKPLFYEFLVSHLTIIITVASTFLVSTTFDKLSSLKYCILKNPQVFVATLSLSLLLSLPSLYTPVRTFSPPTGRP